MLKKVIGIECNTFTSGEKSIMSISFFAITFHTTLIVAPWIITKMIFPI